MKKNVGFSIMILLAMLIVLPVAACHLVVSVGGEIEECTICDSYTYSINIQSFASGSSDTNFLVRVQDTLPAGIQYLSYTDNAPVSGTATCVDGVHGLDPSCTKIQWDYQNVPDSSEWTITLTVKPIGKSDGDIVTNQVQAGLQHRSEPIGGWVPSSVNTLFKDDICPIPSPEFPTIAVPVVLIIGLVGAVLFIRRT